MSVRVKGSHKILNIIHIKTLYSIKNFGRSSNPIKNSPVTRQKLWTLYGIRYFWSKECDLMSQSVDRKASVRVRRGCIKWTEKALFMSHSLSIFYLWHRNYTLLPITLLLHPPAPQCSLQMVLKTCIKSSHIVIVLSQIVSGAGRLFELS